MTEDAPTQQTISPSPELPENRSVLTSRPALVAGMLLLALVMAIIAPLGGWRLYAAGSVALVGLFVLFRFSHAVYIALIAGVAFSLEVRLPGTGVEVVFPTEILIPVLVGAAGVAIFLRGRFRWIHTPLNAAVGCFVLAMLLTVIPSTDRTVTLKAIVRDLSYAVGGFLLIRAWITTRGRLKAFLIARAAVTLLIALYGMYTQMREGVRIYQEIAAPFFREYSVYAAILAMDFAVLSAFLLEYRKGKFRWAGWAVLGVWAFAIAMSFSRGAWLSLGALGCFYAVMERRQINLKVAVSILLIIVIGVSIVGTMQLSALFATRVAHLTDFNFLTNYDRIDRWMAALSIFVHHPLLGVGWGRYADEYFHYIYYTDAYSTEVRMGAHNLYLEMLAESGLVGGVTFALLLGCFFATARNLRKRYADPLLRATLAGVMGAMLTYLVHAFVNNLGPSDKIGLSFWLLIGLIPVLSRLAESRQEET